MPFGGSSGRGPESSSTGTMVMALTSMGGAFEVEAVEPTLVMEEKAPGSGALAWIVPLVAIAAIALAADN